MSEKIQIACNQCGALNRVDARKLGDGPVCGKCRAGLFGPKPMNLTGEGLKRQVEKSDPPLLVDFWAPWCGPCRTMAPAFEQAAGALHPRVRAAKVNTQENQAVASQLGIQSIPTMVLFKGGREAARISGALPAGRIADWVSQNL